MTHGHELSEGRNAGGRGGAGKKGIRQRKKWDNCNSIINKIYLKIVLYDRIKEYEMTKGEKLILRGNREEK